MGRGPKSSVEGNSREANSVPSPIEQIFNLHFSIYNSQCLSPHHFPFVDLAVLNAMTTPPLPEQIELHPDRMWLRDEDLRIESVVDAERFIEDVRFANYAD
jgi:hypothetical protein